MKTDESSQESSDDSGSAAEVVDSLCLDIPSASTSKTQKTACPTPPKAKKSSGGVPTPCFEEGKEGGGVFEGSKGDGDDVDEEEVTLRLNLRGLPLQVLRGDALGSSEAAPLRLLPHQKVVRLSVENSPGTNPAELFRAYVAAAAEAASAEGSASSPCPSSVSLGDGSTFSVSSLPVAKDEFLVGTSPADFVRLRNASVGWLRFRPKTPEEETLDPSRAATDDEVGKTQRCGRNGLCSATPCDSARLCSKGGVRV